ncbi:MAG: DUF6152 family protein [Sphingobium sp.]
MTIKSVLLSFILLALPMAGANAHHSYAAYDMSKKVMINGTVSEIQYANPHTWLFVVVPAEGGKAVTWAIEAGGPNILSRQGWKANTLKAGDKVNALIHPFKDGIRKGGSLEALQLPGARTIGTWKP